MKKVLFGTVLSLAITFSAGIANAAADFTMIKAKVSNGEIKAAEIMTKMNNLIVSANERGLDTTSVEVMYENVEVTYADLQADIDSFQASLDVATEVTPELKAQKDALKTSAANWKTEMLSIRNALKELTS